MRRLLPVITLTLLLALLPGMNPARAADPATYTVAVVPQFDLRRIQQVWGPIVARLEAEAGIRLVLVLDKDIPAFERELHRGAYDFVYMNPYHYVEASRRQGYRALVRDVEAPLSGIVVVAKDSPITRVEELDGKVVAFPSPNAMGAALIPRAEFARKYRIRVQEAYVKSHNSAYLNVVAGQAAAAGGIMATFAQQPAEIRNALRVLFETERYTPHPLAAHPRVPAELAAKIRAALLAMGGEASGKALLAEIPVKRLGPAEDSDYDALRKLGLDAFYVE